MLRELNPNELIEKGDYCWIPHRTPNPLNDPKGDLDSENKMGSFIINPIAHGMTAGEVKAKWRSYCAFADRDVVYRRLEDNEIIERGDTCGIQIQDWALGHVVVQRDAVMMDGAELDFASRFNLITTKSVFYLTAAQARKRFTGKDFFTTRPKNLPIFTEPFGLLEGLK